MDRRLAVVRRRVPVALATLALAGCGGGVFFNFGDAFGDGFAPDVCIAASVDRAAPGQTIRLAAAASDDVGIDRVAFYRADVGADVLLGSVGRAPYQWDAQLPIDASGSLQFFAVATDLEGNQTRSAAVVVFVVP
jgi:hypothetical protein